VTWLLPELELGEEPELRPPDVLELESDPEEVEPDELEPELELEPVEPEEVEPLEGEPELVEAEPLELEPELVEVEPVEVEALAVCVDPGRTRANAPAAATLARVTVVVAVLTLPRPRCLAAIAWRTPSSFVLLMSPSLGRGIRDSLREPSRLPLNLDAAAPGAFDYQVQRQCAWLKLIVRASPRPGRK
jgi:hypothetical protein